MPRETLPETVCQAALDVVGAFENAVRNQAMEVESGPLADGERYVTLKDWAPEWVRDAVKAAHDDGQVLPDDFIYATAREAFEFIAEADVSSEPEDWAWEFSREGADIYNAELLAWLSSHSMRAGYCDEAAEEDPVTLAQPLMMRIRHGQALERERIFGAVLAACEGQVI